jgi:quercetin dioxygenase-like cupin family protein
MVSIELKIAHEDYRGCIKDLISNDEINAITLITFTKGAVRANHYHKKTIQWNYVISGEVLVVTQFPGGRINEKILKKGDFLLTEKNEMHALKGLTDAEVLILTKGPRSGNQYESDTFRLDTPLIVE